VFAFIWWRGLLHILVSSCVLNAAAVYNVCRYEALKRNWEKKLLDILIAEFPQIKDRISYVAPRWHWQPAAMIVRCIFLIVCP